MVKFKKVQQYFYVIRGPIIFAQSSSQIKL